MADSADQSVAIELVAQFQDLMSQLDAVGEKLGSALGSGADAAHDALERVKDDAKEAGDAIGKSGEEAGKKWSDGFALALAAVSATFLDKIRETIETASEYASNLDIMKGVTGNSPAELQKFDFAMRSVGVESGRATQQLALMQRRIEEAASKSNDSSSIFYRLGLSAKQLKANPDAITSFQELAQRISELKSPADQVTASMQLFGGRLGEQLIPLLKQGKTGIEDLMNAAEGKGAIIPDDVIDKLQKYDIAMKQLEQTTQAFFATIAGPIIPALTALANKLMEIAAAFEHLSSDQKLAILFTALTASFFAFEKGLETVGGFLAKNFISREVIDFLKDWDVELKVLSGLAFAVFLAYSSNFANMRTVLQAVFADLKEVFANFSIALREVTLYAQSSLGPAFEKLSQAAAPLADKIRQLADSLTHSINWSAVTQGAYDLVDAFTQLVTWLSELVTWISSNQEALQAWANVIATVAVSIIAGTFAGAVRDAITVLQLLTEGFAVDGVAGVLKYAAALSTGALSAAFSAAAAGFATLKTELLAVTTAFAVDGVAGVVAYARALVTTLVTACSVGVTSLRELITTEAMASLGITLAIALIVAALTTLILNWKEVSNWFETAWADRVAAILEEFSQIVENISEVVRGVAVLLTWLAKLYPALQSDADAANSAADAMDRYAQALDKAAQAKIAANAAKAAGGGESAPYEGTTLGDYHDDYRTPPPPRKSTEGSGTGVLLPAGTKAKKGGGGEAEAEELNRIKEAVDRAKQAFADAKFAVDKLNVAIEALPKDTSLAKIEQLYAEKVQLTTRELAAQRGVVAALRVAQNQAAADEARAHDAKTKRRYEEASQQYKNEGNAAQLEELKLETEITKIKNEGYAKEIAYWSEIAKDSFSTYDQQIKAQEKILALKKQEHETTASIHEAQAAVLAAMQAEGVEAGKLQGIQDKNTEDNLSAATKQQVDFDAAHPKQGDAGVAQQTADKLLQAQTDLTNATMVANDATLARRAADDALLALGPKTQQNSKIYQDALAAQATAIGNETTKLYAESAAKQKVIEEEQATSPIVTDVRNAFKSLIDSGLGTTLVQIIQGLQGSTVNLTQGFISLFEQSRSFHDIQEAFKEITSRLAQVFDALRPVIDFFLGILIGITDVFLELFNVIATVLNVFGLHIQKIKLLDDTLDGLNNTVKPLLTITHDLPTMNEFNAGKWADLQAQNNDLGNNMAIGFNQQAAKLGEVVGVLLGIKVLLGIMAGQSVASQGGGILSGITGFLGKIIPGLGSGSSSSGAGIPDMGDAAGGDFGDSSSQSASAQSSSSSGRDSAMDASRQATQDNTTATTQATVAYATATDSTTSNTTATNNLSASMMSLTSMLGPLVNLFSTLTSGSGSGSGSGLGSLVGGGSNILSSLLNGSKGASGIAGKANLAIGAFTDAVNLFKGLSKGGTFAETLSGVGGGVGTLLGGPIGGAIGSFVGNIVGGFFGPHVSAYKNPDIDDTQNYGQDTANIQGKDGANGQSFTESGADQSAFGGRTGAAAMEIELAKGVDQFMKDTGLSAAQYQTDLQEFGANAQGTGDTVHGKNIGDIGFSGVTGQEGTTRYDALNAALTQFANGLQQAGDALNSTFGNATEANLATVYGNGQVVTASGGYNVTGTGGGSSTSTTSNTAPVMSVTIGTVNGTSEENMRSVLNPIMSDYLQAMQRASNINSNNNSNLVGRQ
jgi:hypothetical protein